MTSLRRVLSATYQLRDYAQHTISNYMGSIALYSKHSKKSPLELKHEHVKEYLIYLRNVKKLAVRTINLHMYSIKSFYEHFLPEQNMVGDIRRMKEPQCHPEILSRQEVPVKTRRYAKNAPNAVMVLAAVLEPVSVWEKLCFAMPKRKNVVQQRIIVCICLHEQVSSVVKYCRKSHFVRIKCSFFVEDVMLLCPLREPIFHIR